MQSEPDGTRHRQIPCRLAVGCSMKDCTEARIRERILRKTKHNRAFTDWLELVTEVLEIAVAVIVLIGFVLSVVPIVRDMPALLDSTNEYTFHIFLEHAFNLVIGIEFIRMLIKHTPGSALEVLLFAIARHMVLSDDSALELVLGVMSIAGIFAIRKYLYVHSFESHEDDTSFEWFRSETEEKKKSRETDAKYAERG